MLLLLFSGIFPEAHTDAVIQIANMVKIEGENEPFIRNCFVIGETAPVIGSEIIVSKSEEELLNVREILKVFDGSNLKMSFNSLTYPLIRSLCQSVNYFQKWAEFVRTIDPDLITGYNIQNFDFPYIVERARALKVCYFLFI